MFIRILSTAILLMLSSWLAFGFDTLAPIIHSNSAVLQFDPSNTAYIESSTIPRAYAFLRDVLFFVLACLMYLTWRKPLHVLFATDMGDALPENRRNEPRGPKNDDWKGKGGVGAIVLALLLLSAQPSLAYYQSSDYADPFFILTNQSAFYIPDVGDNKTNQQAFGSEAYYQEKKIPAKRFIVPHSKLPNSGGWVGSNYYVPDGRLIIVDRTPFYQEWTSSTTTGTGSTDESFHCQAKEGGLNLTLEMTGAAEVSEENAAKFLYHFGVNPPKGDPTDPNVIFTSVYYGKSLIQVMQGLGRSIIMSKACDIVSHYTLDEANSHMADMLYFIQTASAKWFDDYGITLDNIGWAGTFTFDPSVQDALNKAYEANKLKDVMPVLTARANVEVLEGLAAGLRAHGLPTTLLAPSDKMSNLPTLFVPAPSPITK